MSNRQAFIRFKEQLDTRQLTNDPDRDIREHVLSLTQQNVGFGYIAKGLKSTFGANLPNLFDRIVAVDQPGIGDADAYFASGTIYAEPEKSHMGAVRLFNAAPATKEILLFEAGFLATTHSWSHSFKEGNPAYACLGYVYDDIAHYFMADYPNRLTQKLNSVETPSDEELARAGRLLERIVKQRISKYNAQPMRAPAVTVGYARRVLVCDQAYADASTVYGKVGDAEFERMLLAAIVENPDAEILVKTHPDSVWEKDKRTGYYAHLQSTGRVRILRDPVNPYVLFDLVDTVYVGTSQMGLEALFAGKKVVTFGAPFYAGWGLTDDRQTIPHRHRRRSLAEIFHYFYIWYTIYHLPDRKGPAEIEDVLSYIEKNRPYPLPVTEAEISAPPRVSVIVPVHGVEKYLEECITSIQRQTLREIEIIPVNDASPDGSQQIIDRLAADDPRIKPIILSENIGQGFARNRGLEAARGEYIWFLDADDVMPDSDFLRLAADKADSNRLDMVRGRKIIFSGESEFSSEKSAIDHLEKYFPKNITTAVLVENGTALFSWHFWLWLYRREYIEKLNLRFDLTQMEERPFIVKALLGTKNIAALDNVAVAYRKRPASTMRRNMSIRDVDNFLCNIELSIAEALKSDSADQHCDRRRNIAIIATQSLHSFFFNWPYKTIKSSNLSFSEKDLLMARLTRVFSEAGFRSDEIVWSWDSLRVDLKLAGAYELILCALNAARFDWVDYAVNLLPVPQDRLYKELLQVPSSPSEQEFQSALSRYARNKMVQSSGRVPGNANRPRIVIHIGATKTGSTFIQHMLEKNRPALLRQGIWFPEVGLFWQPTRPHKQAGHSAFTRSAVRNEPALRDHIRRGLKLMDGRIHTIVLSSEAYFLHQNAHQIAKYFADHPVEMVVYLRRQDEWANSQYCEFVAGGAVGRVDVPMAEWLDLPETRRRLDYMVPLKAWTDTIGIENVHVRIFDRKEFEGGDLISDFAAAAKLPQLLDLTRPDEREQNDARLASGHVELLRLFNQRPFASQDEYFTFIEEVGSALTAWRRERGLPQPKPWMLSEQQADELMTDYATSNAVIARDYLNRPDKPLFGPRGPVPEQVPVFAEEMALVEQIYQQHAPRQFNETLASELESDVTIVKSTWPIAKRLRVAFKKVSAGKPVIFEKPLLGGTPFTLSPGNIRKYGVIKKQWPKRKRARVILKNIYLGRPIFFR